MRWDTRLSAEGPGDIPVSSVISVYTYPSFTWSELLDASDWVCLHGDVILRQESCPVLLRHGVYVEGGFRFDSFDEVEQLLR